MGWTGSAFDPGIGFVDREAIFRYDGAADYLWILDSENSLYRHGPGIEVLALTRTDGGLESLKRGNSNGRPTKVKLSKAEWEELLHRGPCQFERLDTGARNWTHKLLSQYCHEYLGVQITPSAIGMLLKRLDIKWNRGKLKVTSPDPLYTVKRERVETLKKSLNLGS